MMAAGTKEDGQCGFGTNDAIRLHVASAINTHEMRSMEGLKGDVGQCQARGEMLWREVRNRRSNRD